MKSILLLIFFMSVSIYAQSNSKGPNSPVVVGHIKSANGNIIEVQQGEYLRKLSLTKKSKVVYVSFLGIKEEMKAGYPVKAKVSKEQINSIYITLPVKNLQTKTPEMVKMSATELFKRTDLDSDGKVSYVELSEVVFFSAKHGPDTFIKVDKDKNGTLNLSEFESKMAKVDWWRLSRKSPEKWISEKDKDGNQKLSQKEFAEVAGEGHLESRFKRTDKDNSSDIDLKELTSYINNTIFSKKKNK